MKQSPLLSTSIKGLLGLIAWLWLAPAHGVCPPIRPSPSIPPRPRKVPALASHWPGWAM